MKLYVEPLEVYLHRDFVDFRKSINGLIPFDYIMHCLERLAASSDNVEDLLPRNVKSA